MKAKFLFASTFTLGMLLSFVFFVFFLIAYWADSIKFWNLIALTVVANLILWLVTPTLTDWIQNLFYNVKSLTFEDFSRMYPPVAEFMQKVCAKHRLPLPDIRIIHDANPTAYCYGSFPDNARLVLSEGIFTYLNAEEQQAVVAHELGHIRNWDFAIMTLAVTLLQILYEVYYWFLKKRKFKSRSRNKKDITPMIGAIAYVLYFIGHYLVLFLSRTREYLADRFAAEETQNPDALSMALIKIAYGIATENDDSATKKLLASTRSLGIYDYKAAQSVGGSFALVMKENPEKISYELGKVFLFDLLSPWAFLSELSSTHPLTGKRIQMLSAFAQEAGLKTVFDFEKIIQEGTGIDRARLFRGFAAGAFIYLLPFLGGLLALVAFALHPGQVSIPFLILGGSFILQGLYKFGKRDEPEKTTVLALMQDPYANPLRGRYVEIEGRVIGKADAGSYFGEDVEMQDKSGCLIYLNYESVIPIIGNVLFGLGKAKEVIGREIMASGWFRRTTSQRLDLDRITVDNHVIKSYTRFLELSVGIFLIIAAFVLSAFSFTICP